jgi:hypothetical protein
MDAGMSAGLSAMISRSIADLPPLDGDRDLREGCPPTTQKGSFTEPFSTRQEH